MILEVSHLHKEYQRNDRRFRAVEDVSLTVEPGESICILGRSGSGKSTLLNMLAGLLTPTSGRIAFSGKTYADLGDDELSFLRNTEIGFIPQGHSILPNFTVLDNVRLPHYFYRRQDDPTDQALSLLERVGILPLARQYPAQLSGGELRRVSVARALLRSPRLLIADEPTSDLDAQTSGEVMRLFSELSEDGTAVIIVTHEAGAAEYCGRLFSMEAGRLTENAGN